MRDYSLVIAERKSTCLEEEESELFIEVDCFNVESVLSPAPEGLSQQQVTDQAASIHVLTLRPSFISCLAKPVVTSSLRPPASW